MNIFKDPSSTATNCESHQDCNSNFLIFDSIRPIACASSNWGNLQEASHLTWSESASTAHYVKAHLLP